MTHEAPAIVKLAERVLVEIEKAVRDFPRYHKYAAGGDLRAQARTVARNANRAWRDYPRRRDWVGRLVFSIDDLKMQVQICKQIEAFKSFGQFEALIRLVSDLGRQCGGWQKQQHSRSQIQSASPPYLRYVDDFVLIHQSREQLVTWQERIETFLHDRLQLQLKNDIKLQPLDAGVDFLGYIVKPTHTLVRQRVIAHAREKLRAWRRRPPTAQHRKHLQSLWHSYRGHFSHAASGRLHARFHREFTWLRRELLKVTK